MMKKNMLQTTLLLLLGMITWSCSESDNDTSAKQMRLFKDGVEISELEFSLGAASKMVGVFSDADWDASLDNESWCTISNHAGFVDGDSIQYIKVSVEKNTGSESRTAVLTVKAGSMTRTLTIRQLGMGTDPGDTFQSSFAILEDFTLGYNLGNTLDSNPTSADGNGWWEQRWAAGGTPTTADWETSWGQPVTTQEIINAIAERGFKVIRVPVTWAPHMDAEGNVDAAWMARVKEVVDYVLNAGCYCIVNVMHDTGAASTAWLIADMDIYPTASVRYKKLWTQIANTFKEYGDHLLFESFNEILYCNNNNGWTAPAAGSTSYEAIRRYHQDFVDAVRATGGNNEYRNLIINPYSASSTSTVLNEVVVPKDKHANHIMMSIHSYDPYNFCNDNGEWSILYFNDECRTEIDDVFQRVIKRSGDLGIPVFFGEFGAIDGKKDPDERVKYAAYMAQKFKQYETVGLWWMGLFDRRTMEWTEDNIVSALF